MMRRGMCAYSVRVPLFSVLWFFCFLSLFFSRWEGFGQINNSEDLLSATSADFWVVSTLRATRLAIIAVHVVRSRTRASGRRVLLSGGTGSASRTRTSVSPRRTSRWEAASRCTPGPSASSGPTNSRRGPAERGGFRMVPWLCSRRGRCHGSVPDVVLRSVDVFAWCQSSVPCEKSRRSCSNSSSNSS